MTSKQYIAGFFDADGCVSIIKSKYTNSKRATVRYNPVIFFTNTNIEVLQEIKKTLECGSVYTHKKVKLHWKNRSVLQIAGYKAVFRVLEKLVDFLVIKKPLAEKILQHKIYFADGRSLKHGNQYTGVRPLPKNIVQKRKELYDWCKEFNRKGS